MKINLEPTKKDCIHMVVLYTKGLSESVTNICNKHEIQVHFKGGRTIKKLLIAPKIEIYHTEE